MKTTSNPGHSGEDSSILLQGGTVWHGSAVSPQTGWLHCAEGRITAIGEENITSPEAGRRRQISGWHVLPGLIDSHRHVGLLALLPRLGDASQWASVEQARKLSPTRPLARLIATSGWCSRIWTIPNGAIHVHRVGRRLIVPAVADRSFWWIFRCTGDHCRRALWHWPDWVVPIGLETTMSPGTAPGSPPGWFGSRLSVRPCSPCSRPSSSASERRGWMT